jgi:menaquinone-dependent protoporphyrinogen oxidase
MHKKLLVAYATRADSTREIAKTIAQTLRDAGHEVEVHPVDDVTDLSPYQGVILGTGIRIGHVLPEMLNFVKTQRQALADLPTAYFVVCLTMHDDTPENRQTVEGYLEPLCAIKPPFNKGLFAGRMERSRLEQPWRFLLKYTKEPMMQEGDYRDWEAITHWANQVTTHFTHEFDRELTPA